MISAVSRTLAVLEALSNEPNGVTVSELKRIPLILKHTLHG
jgi:DNA-binding IclR family transcriptional regulator